MDEEDIVTRVILKISNDLTPLLFQINYHMKIRFIHEIIYFICHQEEMMDMIGCSCLTAKNLEGRHLNSEKGN